jgi:hypothetical protein
LATAVVLIAGLAALGLTVSRCSRPAQNVKTTNTAVVASPPIALPLKPEDWRGPSTIAPWTPASRR